MKEQLKKRLVGASVLAALAVIFVPMLIDEQGTPVVAPVKLPPAPPLATPARQPFASEVIKAPQPPEPVPERPAMVEPPPAPAATRVEPESPPAAPPATAGAEKAPTDTTTPRVGLVAWAIQVGSFREQQRAEALVARLRKAGIDTLAPERVEIRGTTWYRVRVGPEVEKQRAEALLPKVNKIAGLQGRVIRYP